MNQIKIGKFIAECRKNKKLTQADLAEKLNITDRAVSKWETGKGMPDSSIMIELCNILGINVNELLSGEKIKMEDYEKKVEDNLIDFKRREEENNKKMLMLENVIAYICIFSFFILLFGGVYAVNNITWRIIMICASIIQLFVGISFALKIETEAGYYECNKCHNKYVPKYSSVYFSMHVGRTRYLKCPKCGKRSWNKKVLTK